MADSVFLSWHLNLLSRGGCHLDNPHVLACNLVKLLTINFFIHACLNFQQLHNLAWQPCDDSWARAVFKMATFSNVPIVVMWTFVRNRMLPQIKQQQLEPYCSWYYYIFFLFPCSVLGLLSPWYQTTAKRTTWVSRVNILRVYSLRFT